jgi:protein-tyrosine phosphatase
VRAIGGIPATAVTRQVMGWRGLNVEDHRSRFAGADLLHSAGVVVVMTEAHREALAGAFPAEADKVILLSSLIGETGDIADPVGGSEQEYESCAGAIARILDRGFEKLASAAGG